MATVTYMDVSQQIAAVWQARAAEIGMVWWLLPGFGQREADHAESSNLQARITAGLLLTPFDAESGREVGAQLAHHFRFHLEKLGRLQRLLAEQLLAGLDDRQTAWLAPRLAACWGEMTVGYGQALRALYLDEQAALQEKLRAEAQQAAAQAEASAQRFEELFRHAHHPVVLHENGRILAVNQAVTDAFGYPPQALVGQTMQTLVETLAPVGEQARILARIQSGDARPYQTQCITRDGTAVPIVAHPRPVEYQGRPVQMVLIRPLTPDSPTLPPLEEVDLSPRQIDVLWHMANGRSDREIAEILEITLSTVHYHKGQIFAKLGVETRIAAVAWAWQMLVGWSGYEKPDTLEGDGSAADFS